MLANLLQFVLWAAATYSVLWLIWKIVDCLWQPVMDLVRGLCLLIQLPDEAQEDELAILRQQVAAKRKSQR